jgi:hypothetical protein
MARPISDPPIFGSHAFVQHTFRKNFANFARVSANKPGVELLV